MCFYLKIFLFIFLSVFVNNNCQRNAALPLSFQSFRQIHRTKITVPDGRKTKLNDVLFRHYGNSTLPTSSHRLPTVAKLLSDKFFDMKKPTVIYAHGYVELTSDESVQTIVQAYVDNAGYNIIVVDWANLAFGNYFAVALDLKSVGIETGKAIASLLKGGIMLDGLHLVGHSLGAHLLAFAAKELKLRGFIVSRITGLDPAYPGFYPALLNAPLSVDDAEFVDVLHTDGGGFGAPDSVGHADYWPNGGTAKQPGCISATIPLTYEDFCSHWRSWAFWAESVRGGEFLARRCKDYDSFLRGDCQEELVDMGVRASPDLRGNFYLRTAAMEPFALGRRGAD